MLTKIPKAWDCGILEATNFRGDGGSPRFSSFCMNPLCQCCVYKVSRVLNILVLSIQVSLVNRVSFL